MAEETRMKTRDGLKSEGREREHKASKMDGGSDKDWVTSHAKRRRRTIPDTNDRRS